MNTKETTIDLKVFQTLKHLNQAKKQLFKIKSNRMKPFLQAINVLAKEIEGLSEGQEKSKSNVEYINILFDTVKNADSVNILRVFNKANTKYTNKLHSMYRVYEINQTIESVLKLFSDYLPKVVHQTLVSKNIIVLKVLDSLVTMYFVLIELHKEEGLEFGFSDNVDIKGNYEYYKSEHAILSSQGVIEEKDLQDLLITIQEVISNTCTVKDKLVKSLQGVTPKEQKVLEGTAELLISNATLLERVVSRNTGVYNTSNYNALQTSLLLSNTTNTLSLLYTITKELGVYKENAYLENVPLKMICVQSDLISQAYLNYNLITLCTDLKDIMLLLENSIAMLKYVVDISHVSDDTRVNIRNKHGVYEKLENARKSLKLTTKTDLKLIRHTNNLLYSVFKEMI